MADWKMPVSYNYNPPYHAYAYGLMYSQGPEQAHPNMTWAEAAYGSPAGVTGGFYSSPAPPQSPPGSPVHEAEAGGHYPSSVVYYTDSQTHTQNGRLFFSHSRVHYGQPVKEQEQAGSDPPSDSEAHTPDSWSSGSSREAAVPQPDLDRPAWLKKELPCGNGGSPDGSEVSSSFSAATEEPRALNSGGEDLNPVLPSTIVPSPPEQLAARPRKAKARTAFSEVQMNALTDRFNVQRYLTPAEMKTLAGFTGLTYKQVKTWFQNRRMKLKRHQKDNSWVSERYITPGMPNGCHSQFQVDGPMLSQELYNNPQFRDTVFKKSPPQTPSFYPSYTRPLSPSQVSTRPQGAWPLPPAVMHYESVNRNAGISSEGGNAVDPGSSPTEMTPVHNAPQWSS